MPRSKVHSKPDEGTSRTPMYKHRGKMFGVEGSSILVSLKTVSLILVESAEQYVKLLSKRVVAMC